MIHAPPKRRRRRAHVRQLTFPRRRRLEQARFLARALERAIWSTSPRAERIQNAICALLASAIVVIVVRAAIVGCVR